MDRIVFIFPGEDTFSDLLTNLLAQTGIKNEKNPFLTDETILLGGLTKQLFDKQITEQAMVDSLQQNLRTTKEISQAIVAEVKTKILPFGKKISDAPTQPTSQPNLTQPPTAAPIKKPQPVAAARDDKFANLPKKNPQASKKDDAYREPI